MSDVDRGPLNTIHLTNQGFQAQNPNSGWPSFNRVPGPVKGSPRLVWLPASITSCNLHCSLGGRPAGWQAGGQLQEGRGEQHLHKAWKARPQQAARGRTTPWPW